MLLAILTAPYLFLVPTSAFYYNPLNITNYDNTSIESTAKMNQIFKYIENDPYKIEETKIDKEKKEVTLNIVNSDEYYNYYIIIEEYASLLFALTNDLNKVTIEVNDINYEFEYNHINDIYNKKIRDIDISKIYNREAEIYSDTSIYMGNIDGKYDLFDESENCSTDIVPLYEDDYNKYSISCNDIEKLFIKDNNKKINIKEALNNKLFNVSDLSTTTIRIYKEAK